MMGEARAAKAQLVSRQLAERQALRERAHHSPAHSHAEQDHREAQRAFIDNDFADRFARILRETPAEQRAAALARLRDLKAASLANLSLVTMVRPSGAPKPVLAVRSLSAHHRAERKALAQMMAARRAIMVLGFQNAQNNVTAPANGRLFRSRRIIKASFEKGLPSL